MLRSHRVWILLAWITGLGACSPAPKSHTAEGIDANNRFELLDYKGQASIDEIIAAPRVSFDRIPWTDTYWPLTGKGLSKRWDVTSPNNEKDPNVWPSVFFRTHLEYALGAFQINPLLSPAEKYDLVFRWRHNRNLDWNQMRPLLDSLYSIEEQIKASNGLSEKKAKVRELYSAFVQGQGGLLREVFPMTADGWNSWLSFTGQPDLKYLGGSETGKDWHWMGYCHGWAPAALMEEAPRHGVLVNIGWQEVLFTEGDIRGLLTKSWADFWPSQDIFFVGRRCNKNTDEPEGDIPHGSSGKGLYGSIKMTEGDSDRNFYVNAEYYAGFAQAQDRIYPVSYAEGDQPQGFLLERIQSPGKGTSYVYAASISDLQRYVESGIKDGVQFPYQVELYGCWDVNPATFHMALITKLGKGKSSFVIDRTRTGQVWNQPIYEAKFKFSDLKLASAVSDLAAAYRAPGTKYLLEVKAEVKWTSEPTKARLVYEAGFDKRYLITNSYQYTLEFDRAKRLIGGEWGTLSEINPHQITPDFLFGFKEGAKPYDDIGRGFDYSGLIAKIHDCSLSSQIDGTRRIDDQDIEFTRCSIEKAD